MSVSFFSLLLVEDDPRLEEILSAALRGDDIQVSGCATGRRAIQLSQKNSFDLILLDLGLPDVTGFEVLRQLKESHHTSETPVIILTAWQSADDKLRGFELGAVDYITKPFDLSELRARIRAALQTKRRHDDLTRASQTLAAARFAAEDNARAKGEFLAHMSHEIRTPMNGVIAMTDLLLRTPLNHDQREIIDTIRSSGESLLTIVNDTLSFSKLESGKLELENQPFDLRVCAEEAIDILALQAAKKGLGLGLHVHPHLPTQVIGDANRFRQILINLLSNAVKFTSQGQVAVQLVAEHAAQSTATAQATPPAPQNPAGVNFLVTVRDTGVGIPEEGLKKLFAAFAQTDSSISRLYGGTGLGLAISKRLVELMRGTMWAESTVGVGSAFHFRVPFQICAEPPTADWQKPAAPFAGRHAIALLGTEVHRPFLEACAGAWGLMIRSALTFREAAALFSPEIPTDLAIVDSGSAAACQFIQHLRENPSTAGTPLLLLDHIGAKPEPAGAFGLAEQPAILPMPIKTAQFYAALQKALSTRPVPSTAPPRPDLPASTPKSALRVLVADDNPINQRVAVRLLRQLGYEAETAADGEEVLRALERTQFDVILMDVQMPRLNGLETAKRIRASSSPESSQGAPAPRIIAVTAKAMAGDREKCLAAGMDDYLPKPIRPEMLRLMLENHNGRAVSPPHQHQTVAPEPLPVGAPALAVGDAQCRRDEPSARAAADHRPRVGQADNSTAAQSGVCVPSHSSSALVARPDDPTETGPPLDVERFIELAGGTRAGVEELLDVFFKQTFDQLENLRDAVQTGSANEVARLAHSCSGAAGACGMAKIHLLLKRLEGIASQHDMSEAPQLLGAVFHEFDRLKAFLADFTSRESAAFFDPSL